MTTSPNVVAAVADVVGHIDDADSAPLPQPTPSSSRPVPVPSVRPPMLGNEPTIDALINAAARSTSKRTQALGIKLANVATIVRDRLRDERQAAETAERERLAREQAAAEVERLEAQLREAKAKLGKQPRSAVSSEGRRAAGHAVAAKYAGQKPCEKCGKDLTTLPGPRGAHMKRCTGGAS